MQPCTGHSCTLLKLPEQARTCHDQLPEAQQQCHAGRVLAGRKACLGEDVGRIVEHRGLPRDLLEQHERHADRQRAQVAPPEQPQQPYTWQPTEHMSEGCRAPPLSHGVHLSRTHAV